MTSRLRRYAVTRDPQLRDELLIAYAGFARSLARRFPSRREMSEDLVQVAHIGLLQALDRFDPDRGTSFAAFASTTIVGELKRHMRDHSWVMNTPRRLQENYLHVARAVEELTHLRGRSPTVPEIAALTNLSDEDVLEAMEVRAAQRPLSLDAPLDDGPVPLGDLVGHSDDDLASVERRALLDDLLGQLHERERRILQLRFVDDLTQAEIADHLGVNQMYVSRSLARILARLRHLVDPSSGAGGPSG